MTDQERADADLGRRVRLMLELFEAADGLERPDELRDVELPAPQIRNGPDGSIELFWEAWHGAKVAPKRLEIGLFPDDGLEDLSILRTWSPKLGIFDHPSITTPADLLRAVAWVYDGEAEPC